MTFGSPRPLRVAFMAVSWTAAVGCSAAEADAPPGGGSGASTTELPGGGAGGASTGGGIGVGGSGAGVSSMTGGTGGVVATGGTPPVGGAGPSGGTGPTGGTAPVGGAGPTAGTGGSVVDPPTEPFSFFVTSLRAMQEVSGSPDGFGGDLRFGETGPGAGLRGADKICATIADRSMPGASAKGWRAFLSATADENGNQVNAIDRIGEGPWYDRLGRLVAMSKQDLLNTRPLGADPAIIDDLPNEDGVPNHQPDPTQPEVDNHDTLTGSDAQGQLYSATATCLDWTSAIGDVAVEGTPRVGHSWPRDGFGGTGGGGFQLPGNVDMAHWISSLDEAGCRAGVSIIEMGPPNPLNPTVGSGGGYGGIYCFALVP